MFCKWKNETKNNNILEEIMKCKKCSSELTSPKGVMLLVCPFCGTNAEGKEQVPLDNYGQRLFDMIQQRGKDVYQNKYMLSNFVGDIFYDNIRLQNTIRLAINNDVANKLLDLGSLDEQKQKTEIVKIIHILSKENGLESVRAVDAVKTLAIGLGINNNVLENITYSQIAPTNLLKKVLTEEDVKLSATYHVEIPYGCTDIERNSFASDYSGFFGCDSLTNMKSVTIPDSVTNIGESAFENCYYLESIVIPYSVMRIGEKAFHSCSKLSKVVISGNLVFMGEGAFSGCTELKELVIIGDIQNISNTAFHQCKKLKSLTLPNSIKSIGFCAFYACLSLRSVTLSEGVESIGYEAFSYCRRLKKIIIPNSIKYIGEGAFKACDELTVFCSKDSYVYDYCVKNGIRTNTSCNDNISLNDALYKEMKNANEENDIAECINAALKGDSDAQFNLSIYYIQGIGVKKDFNSVIQWLSNAAVQGNKRAVNSLRGMYKEKDPTMIEKCYDLAKRGLAQAQAMLGLFYMHGIAVDKDQEQGIYWQKKAAENNFGSAQCGLGFMYIEGIVVEKDIEFAFHWFEKAANNGNIDAQIALSDLYIKAKEDKVQSIYWRMKAAEQGHKGAQYDMSHFLLHGICVEKNPVQVMKWCWKAAEQGGAEAQCLLGECFADVNNIFEDPVIAVQWYKKSAEQGHAEAQRKLAFCYANGDGVDEDDTQMKYWFNKAAEQEDVIAQYELGMFYEKGSDTEKDLVQAVFWYKKAAEQDHSWAQYRLAKCYRDGLGTEKDPVQAANWFYRSASARNGNALFLLGVCCIEGIGVEKDMARAMSYFWQLIEDGNEQITQCLNMIYPPLNDFFAKTFDKLKSTQESVVDFKKKFVLDEMELINSVNEAIYNRMMNILS